MKILIDMNLSPAWVVFLQTAGFHALHWSQVGNANAPDNEIMSWALANGYIVFTHDLDFSAILSSTNAAAPSVFQVRTQDTLPDALGIAVVQAFQQLEAVLLQGALVTLDTTKTRVRVLPMHH